MEFGQVCTKLSLIAKRKCQHAWFGMHVSCGSLLCSGCSMHATWVLCLCECREWEVSLLARDPEDAKQQQRVRALFHRQLQVPLADGAATLAACQAWETKLQPGAEVLAVSLVRGMDKGCSTPGYDVTAAAIGQALGQLGW